MTMPPAPRSAASPAILAVNLLLTMAVGTLLGLSVGQPLWVGAVGGTLVGALIIALLAVRQRLRIPRPDIDRFDKVTARIAAPFARLAALIEQFWARLQTQVNRWRPAAEKPVQPARPAGARHRFPEVETGDAIALAIGNIVLLLMLAVLLFGFGVAYVVAVIATPIWLLALMILALDGSDAGTGIPLPDDLEAPE